MTLPVTHTKGTLVGKGLDPFRNMVNRNGAPYPLHYQGRDRSLR